MEIQCQNVLELLPKFCNEKRTATKKAFVVEVFVQPNEKHKVTHAVGFSITTKLYKFPFVAVPFSLQTVLGAKFRY